MKHVELIEEESGVFQFYLFDENGKKYRLIVGTDGTLSTEDA